MNWKDYFDLKERRKRNFKKAFILLLIIGFFMIKGVLFDGETAVCEKINISCVELQEETNIDLNDTNLTNSSLDFNQSLNNGSENMPLIEGDLVNDNTNESNGFISGILDHVWIDCDLDCSLSIDEEIKILGYRLFKTPLIVAVMVILAYIISFGLFRYSLFKTEHVKEEKEEEGDGDKKDEKKE